jgi:hypothetical protein
VRHLFRRYTQLTVPQKRLYSLLTVVTAVAVLLYCLGIGGLVARSHLVPEVALESSPTAIATSTLVPTSVAWPEASGIPTATLPPTPTQRPIPTFTPTPESVNVTVVITDTQGVTTTVVISATVTPTPNITPTVTITAEACLTVPRTRTTPPVSQRSQPSGPERRMYDAPIAPSWGHETPGKLAFLGSSRQRFGQSMALAGERWI